MNMRLAVKILAWTALAALSCLFAQQPNGTATPPGKIGPDGAYRVGNGVTPPTALTRVAGAIPDLARQLRASGEVLLSVVVQADGGLRDFQIVKSAGYGMDEKATEAVRKWRFRAGTKDGEPVDVRVNVVVSFSVAPEENTWGAGPLLFDVLPGLKLPILKSGSMPKAVRQSGDETVVLQFTVDPRGEVMDIHAVQGESSASVPVLIASISKWKFEPASDGNTSVPATGKLLLIKGEDQFRYEVASAFRDSGSPETKPRVPSTKASSPPTVTVVPVKIRLEPDEASKQLVHSVQPTYPPEAKVAGVEGTVVVEITIDLDGSVSDVREITGPKELVPAAIAAVKQSKYRATIYHGRPWQATTEVEIRFKLAQ
jgi:TonB family protein